MHFFIEKKTTIAYMSLIDIIGNKVLGHTTVRPERVEGYIQDMLRQAQHERKKEFLISDNV